jgi:hypothetical protein
LPRNHIHPEWFLQISKNNLRQKAMQGYFSLKSMIDLGHLKKSIVFKLFDALILPVVAYGCQIKLPYTNLIKSLVSDSRVCLKKLARDPLERVHLSFLKWALSVGKYTSNAAIWGDSGRYPLATDLTQQVYSYSATQLL